MQKMWAKIATFMTDWLMCMHKIANKKHLGGINLFFVCHLSRCIGHWIACRQRDAVVDTQGRRRVACVRAQKLLPGGDGVRAACHRRHQPSRLSLRASSSTLCGNAS